MKPTTQAPHGLCAGGVAYGTDLVTLTVLPCASQRKSSDAQGSTVSVTKFEALPPSFRKDRANYGVCPTARRRCWFRQLFRPTRDPLNDLLLNQGMRPSDSPCPPRHCGLGDFEIVSQVPLVRPEGLEGLSNNSSEGLGRPLRLPLRALFQKLTGRHHVHLALPPTMVRARIVCKMQA
jgi:hypothetical protein